MCTIWEKELVLNFLFILFVKKCCLISRLHFILDITVEESAIDGVTAAENAVAQYVSAAENDAMEVSEREESHAGIPAKRAKRTVENPKSTGTYVSLYGFIYMSKILRKLSSIIKTLSEFQVTGKGK